MGRPVTGNQNWQCIVPTGSGKIMAPVEMSEARPRREILPDMVGGDGIEPPTYWV